MALLLCLFVTFMVSGLVIAVLDTEMLQLSAARNVCDYERALYLANAGVHHACVELQRRENWRGIATEGTFPFDDSYQAIASDDGNGNVAISATGVSGEVRRTVNATVEL